MRSNQKKATSSINFLFLFLFRALSLQKWMSTWRCQLMQTHEGKAWYMRGDQLDVYYRPERHGSPHYYTSKLTTLWIAKLLSLLFAILFCLPSLCAFQLLRQEEILFEKRTEDDRCFREGWFFRVLAFFIVCYTTDNNTKIMNKEKERIKNDGNSDEGA